MNQKNHGFLTALSQVRASVIASCTLLLCAMSTCATSWVWTGGGAPDGNWNNSANWGSAGIPANGDSVVSPGRGRADQHEQYVAGLTLGQIKFISGGFNIYGNPFTITNSIVVTNNTGTDTIYITNTVLATADVTMLISNGASLTFNGNLSGNVGVVKTASVRWSMQVNTTTLIPAPHGYSGACCSWTSAATAPSMDRWS